MDTTNLQDAELLYRFIAGDSESFGVLYDRYLKKMYNFVFYRVGHRETAEDITSRIFLKAMKSARAFRAGRGSFSTWLYAIARNAIIDHYRTLKIEFELKLVFDRNDSKDMEEMAEDRLMLEKAQKFINTLSGEQKDVIVMRIWDGLSYREIAEITGKSEASCRMLFSRTVSTLRRRTVLSAVMYLLIGF